MRPYSISKSSDTLSARLAVLQHCLRLTFASRMIWKWNCLLKLMPLLAALAVCAYPAAQASEKTASRSADSATKKEPKPAAAKKTKAKTKSTSKVPKLLPNSSETAAERANRLKRECQGQVNAGACSGYTR